MMDAYDEIENGIDRLIQMLLEVAAYVLFVTLVSGGFYWLAIHVR